MAHSALQHYVVPQNPVSDTAYTDLDLVLGWVGSVEGRCQLLGSRRSSRPQAAYDLPAVLGAHSLAVAVDGVVVEEHKHCTVVD